MVRDVVKIDEDLCNGCGVCIPSCHEGALQIIDGKARLISDLMCVITSYSIHYTKLYDDIKYQYPTPYTKIYNLFDALKKGELFDTNVPKSDGAKYPRNNFV